MTKRLLLLFAAAIFVTAVGGVGVALATVADDLGVPTCTIDPDTGQCWVDTDRDGIQDSADNCRTTYNPDQADNDHDGIGNVCDPTPDGGGGGGGGGGSTPPDLNVQLVAGAGTALPEENVTNSGNGGQAAGLSVRCKTQRYVQTWTQLGLYDVLKVETRFRVCYVPNKRIYSFKREDPLMNPNPESDAIYVRAPWDWNGVDSTYPQVAVYTDRVEMKVQGSSRFCIFTYGCGPTRHPWVRIVFRPNNTMVVTSGVV